MILIYPDYKDVYNKLFKKTWRLILNNLTLYRQSDFITNVKDINDKIIYFYIDIENTDFKILDKIRRIFTGQIYGFAPFIDDTFEYYNFFDRIITTDNNVNNTFSWKYFCKISNPFSL